MAKRYDLDAARAAYDECPPAHSSARFWDVLAMRMGRGRAGVYARLCTIEGWAPKLDRPVPCAACGLETSADDFADDGRSRVCATCADAMEGRR